MQMMWNIDYAELHTQTPKRIKEAINDLRNWELYQEKPKTRVEGNQKRI